MKLQEKHRKYKLQVDFRNFEINKVKTSVSAVKRIGQRLVIKDTLNRKVPSGRPRVATISYNHRLKMTILKKNFCCPHKKNFPNIFDKNFISFTLLDFVNLEK